MRKLLLIILFFSSLSLTLGQDSTTFVFIIINAENGSPIPLVELNIFSSEADTMTYSSDADGRIDFTAVKTEYSEFSTLHFFVPDQEEFYLGVADSFLVHYSNGFQFIEVSLKPINGCMAPLLLFNKGTTEISDSSYMSIESIYDMLLSNPYICIEIQSQYLNNSSNELAQRRAKIVFEELIEMGIDERRLSIGTIHFDSTINGDINSNTGYEDEVTFTLTCFDFSE